MVATLTRNQKVFGVNDENGLEGGVPESRTHFHSQHEIVRNGENYN